MGEDNLEWLASLIPGEELDRRISEIDDQMADLAMQREVLRTALHARNRAVAARSHEPHPTMQFGPNSNGKNGRPSLRNALREIFNDSETGTLKKAEIIEAMIQRDWLPETDDPGKLVGSVISAMVKRTHELEPTGEVATYRLAPNTDRLRPRVPRGRSRVTGPVSNRPFTGAADGKAESEKRAK
jgi:hypothetical protein